MPDERNILASFTDPEQAQDCANSLREQGFDAVQVDDVPSMQSQSLPHSPLVNWGRYGYQADTLDDKWTGSSAWQNDGLVLGEGWLLTVVVPRSRYEDAARIVHQYGGTF